MNEAEIAEAFIRSAEIERRMPRSGERPRGFGGYPLATIHTYEDKLNWRKEFGDQLHRGDDPLAEERHAFTDGQSSRVTTADVTDWEACLRWTIELLGDPRERRALWAWAFAKAGGKPFNKWCFRIEGIHPETGRRRKDRAIARISGQLARSDTQNNETAEFGVLLCGPEIGDSAATMDVDARKTETFWRDEDFRAIHDRAAERDFSWADARNKKRREREAKRRHKDQKGKRSDPRRWEG